MKKPAYKKRKTYHKKKPSKALVKTIHRVINRDQEMKYVTYYAQNQTPTFYNTTTSAMTTYQLIPTIVQGTGYNNRIANQIQVMSHIVKYRLFVPQGSTATEPLYVRVFVGHIRPYPASSPLSVASGYSDLFRIGTGVASPQLNDLDIMMKTNTENWVIVYDKTHKIGQSGQVSGDPQTSNNDFHVSSFGHINLTKHMGKLMFNDQATNLPTNKNWFLFIAAARTGGASATTGSNVSLGFTYDSQLSFKDA